jgi:23S rRNA pseudouridine955/2504/2580 synthase
MLNIPTTSVGLSALELRLVNGRTDRIGVHQVHAGHPVLGGGNYGDYELHHALPRQVVNRLPLRVLGIAFSHSVGASKLRLHVLIPEDILAPGGASYKNADF